MPAGLSRSVAWYTVGNIFIRSASFLLLPLYANYILPSDFGIYSVIMSFYAVLSVLFQGGLQAALSKFYIEREEKTEIFSVVMNIILVWGTVLTVIVLLTAPSFSGLLLGTEKYSSLIRLITISIFAETIVFFILHLFKTREEARRAVLYGSAGALMNIALNIFYIYFRRGGIEGIIKAQLFSSLLTMVILLPYFISSYRVTPATFFKPEFFRPLLFFSLPVFLSGIFSSLVDVADRFVINHVLGEFQTGVYSFAYRIALVMNVFVISFRTAFTPYSIRVYSLPDNANRLGRVLVNLVASGGFLMIAVSFFASDLFHFRIFGYTLFTQTYESGIFVLPFILAGYFFSAIMSFYSVYPYVSGRSYHFLFSDALAFGVNIILNLILIPTAGIRGAAVATLFAFLTGAAYLYTVSAPRIRITYYKKSLSIIVITAVLILTAGMYIDKISVDIILLIVYMLIIFSVGGVKLIIFKSDLKS